MSTKRTMPVQIRLTPEEKDGFKKAADLAGGGSFASWARDRLRRIAAQELREAGQRVPFINDE